MQRMFWGIKDRYYIVIGAGLPVISTRVLGRTEERRLDAGRVRASVGSLRAFELLGLGWVINNLLCQPYELWTVSYHVDSLQKYCRRKRSKVTICFVYVGMTI